MLAGIICNCLQNKDFKFIGLLVVTSIVQGGPGLPVFLPAAYHYICAKEENIKQSERVPDTLVRELLCQVRMLNYISWATSVHVYIPYKYFFYILASPEKVEVELVLHGPVSNHLTTDRSLTAP